MCIVVGYTLVPPDDPELDALRGSARDDADVHRADAMTKNTAADMLDARDVVRKDPLTLLRAIYVALDMLDDELGNDTDMSAAVGDVIEAKKHVKEAIDTLEHLYDDDNARKPSELGDAQTSPPSDVAVGSVPAGGSDGRRAVIDALYDMLMEVVDISDDGQILHRYTTAEEHALRVLADAGYVIRRGRRYYVKGDAP